MDRAEPHRRYGTPEGAEARLRRAGCGRGPLLPLGGLRRLAGPLRLRPLYRHAEGRASRASQSGRGSESGRHHGGALERAGDDQGRSRGPHPHRTRPGAVPSARLRGLDIRASLPSPRWLAVARGEEDDPTRPRGLEVRRTRHGIRSRLPPLQGQGPAEHVAPPRCPGAPLPGLRHAALAPAHPQGAQVPRPPAHDRDAHAPGRDPALEGAAGPTALRRQGDARSLRPHADRRLPGCRRGSPLGRRPEPCGAGVARLAGYPDGGCDRQRKRPRMSGACTGAGKGI